MNLKKIVCFLFIAGFCVSLFGQSGILDAYSKYTIAYSSDETGNPEIYLSDLEGKEKLQITDYELRDGYTAFSPDGKRIAFYAYYDEGKTWSIHTMNIDGTDRKRITSKKNVYDSSPSWSPDGKRIVFSRDDPNWQYLELYIIDADGSNLQKLNIASGINPCFTPDGRIIYGNHWDDSAEICLADLDGSNITQLTNNNNCDGHPNVSSDGKKVVFYSERDGNREVYTMNIDGSNQTRLTNNSGDDWSVSWSPDASKIAFISNRDGDYDVYLMNSDGSDLRNITNNDYIDLGPVFLIHKDCSEDSQKYLRQETPGVIPQVFAAGVVSTGAHEISLTISKDLSNLYVVHSDLNWNSHIFQYSMDGESVKRELVPFARGVGDCYPFLSPSNDRVLFNSIKKLSDRAYSRKVYVSESLNGVWSASYELNANIDSSISITSPSIAANGNIYFNARMVGGKGGSDIYCLKKTENGYSQLENLGVNINSEYNEFHPFISPDESFIMFDAEYPEGYGSNDIYISYKNDEGHWTKPRNLGECINTKDADMRPYLSPDAKYLFFVSNRGYNTYNLGAKLQDKKVFMESINGPGNGSQDIYWVDSKVVLSAIELE